MECWLLLSSSAWPSALEGGGVPVAAVVVDVAAVVVDVAAVVVDVAAVVVDVAAVVVAAVAAFQANKQKTSK